MGISILHQAMKGRTSRLRTPEKRAGMLSSTLIEHTCREGIASFPAVGESGPCCSTGEVNIGGYSKKRGTME